jgi:aarF domain-containing kinase
MAGKQLLDAAKLFDAGRAIGKQHIALRQQQWDVYSKTSGLAKAVKDQTDRVTVTAGAAYELAKRVNETGPSWQEQSGQQSSSRRARENEASRESGVGRWGISSQEQTQSANVASGTQARSDLRSQEEKVIDDGSLSSLRKREIQRRAEQQIPSASSDGSSQDGALGGDAFNARPESVSAELSSLPRMKIPKQPESSQSPVSHVSGSNLNPDVFSGRGVKTEDEGLPEGASLDGAFASRRVSQMIGRSGGGFKNPYAGRQKLPPKALPEMVTAEERRKSEAQVRNSPKAEEATNATSHIAGGDRETQKLAEAIAAETEPNPVASEVSSPDTAGSTSYEMHESRVPSSRFGRLWQYGGLATSMAFGAVGEGFRRITGSGAEGSLMLSESNMNRLVAKLSRMRGAALKLGQMISFQDSKILPPTINAVLQRVQDSADYMPPSQRDKVLVENLGSNWRDLFSNFEEKPFAAASIGQVHKATLASNGRDVAVKVQYPGVRDSIDSDLNNLALLLTASKLLPKGLYLDKTIANARVELGWECDYEREARACIRFAELLDEENNIFKVPDIYTEASGPGVLTAEFMNGTAVTKMKDLSQSDRDWVGTQILRLCLRELMEWRFMQTDPNWTNFLYNRDSQKLELLDFGASRDFPDKFVEPYVGLLIAASKGDRDSCRDLSIQLGYLTGYEGNDMLKAHVDSIMTLAEPFVETAPEVYDFEDQTITDRVRSNIGLMLRERLAPPPEETYSLHRKLSGAFLLCARLRSRVRAREMFARAVEVWNRRQPKNESETSL